MSTRQIRRYLGVSNTLPPPPEGDSDEDYEPLYAKNPGSMYNYRSLQLSSSSESEHESNDASAEQEEEEVVPVENRKKKKNNKKKKKQQKAKLHTEAKENSEELDEIDRSLKEVNALLGSPVAVPSTSTESPRKDPRTTLMAITAKNLDSDAELNRKFGPEEPEPGAKKKAQPPRQGMTRALIIKDPHADDLRSAGLSMAMERRENNNIYFVFEHSRHYQNMHWEFLQTDSNYGPGNLAYAIEEAQLSMHVELMLECVDRLLKLESYQVANELLERTISYMQNAAHILFNITDKRVRLEYKFMENRPFHIAVLKYAYMLSNRACHRTAMELAKLLLNLDPSDPLAVLFVIDTFALRARQHQWLIDAINVWSKERDAHFLFNIQYSYALSHFHVTKKNKGDFTEANKLLQEAFLRFPVVALRLMKGTPLHAKLLECPIFSSAEENTNQSMKDLMQVYAKLVSSRWRERPVLAWFTDNVDKLIKAYKDDPSVQESGKKKMTESNNIFRSWPVQVTRHLCVIKAMEQLLIEEALPRVPRGRVCDPLPPADGVSRHGYDKIGREPQVAMSTPFLELFTSVLPRYVLPPMPHNVPELMEVDRRENPALAQWEQRGNEFLRQMVIDDDVNDDDEDYEDHDEDDEDDEQIFEIELDDDDDNQQFIIFEQEGEVGTMISVSELTEAFRRLFLGNNESSAQNASSAQNTEQNASSGDNSSSKKSSQSSQNGSSGENNPPANNASSGDSSQSSQNASSGENNPPANNASSGDCAQSEQNASAPDNQDDDPPLLPENHN